MLAPVRIRVRIAVRALEQDASINRDRADWTTCQRARVMPVIIGIGKSMCDRLQSLHTYTRRAVQKHNFCVRVCVLFLVFMLRMLLFGLSTHTHTPLYIANEFELTKCHRSPYTN